MKKLFMLFGLLPALILPGRAQEPQEFKTGAEYVSFIQDQQRRRAEILSMQDEAVAARQERVASLEKELEACTDPQQRSLLQDRLYVERRMIGEVGSRYLQDLADIDERIISAEQRYQFVFPEAFPYYRDREEYSKEELRGFLKQASGKIRRSEQGKALKKYIKSLP